MEKETKKIRGNKYACQVTLTEYVVEDGVVEIGEYAFHCCTNLERIKMVRGTRRIRDYAFFNCPKLKYVSMKDGLEEIGRHAFESCLGLERVTLVKGIRQIGSFAFIRTKLKHLEIHEGIEDIGEAIVAYAPLETITLPLHHIKRFNRFALSGAYSRRSPVASLKTLRLRTIYRVSPSISLPRRVSEEDKGELVRFLQLQQRKYTLSEIHLVNTIFYICFSVKSTHTGLYNAYGVPVLARIFRFSFRGASLPFPVRGANKIRLWAAKYRLLQKKRHRGLF